MDEEEEEEGCNESLESFPLSTWSQDCGLRALSWVSLQDSEGKKVLIGHKRWNKSQISTIARWVSLSKTTQTQWKYGGKTAPFNHKSLPLAETNSNPTPADIKEEPKS